jgi:hypothetical protein
MEPYVTVTTPDGWSKDFALQGNLIYVGSAPDNNIVLGPEQGRGVSHRHVQIIATPEGYRAVNLGDTGFYLGDAEVEPHFAVDVDDGANLMIGEFGLVFHYDEVPGTFNTGMPSVSAPVFGDTPQAGNAIGLALSLPRTIILDPDEPVDGRVIVRNMGTESGVQFQIELEGLGEDCYEMGPGPILFPNAEKEVFLRLRHPRTPHPPAGEHRIRIRASAPDAYPGQSAVESRQVNIVPYHEHTMRLVDTDVER